MKVGLFIPCYIDQFYPNVAIATLQLLERLDCTVDYPMAQTCCGQPMANAGYETSATACYRHFVDVFAPYDAIVAPSGSCTYHVKQHYDILEQTERVRYIRDNIYDLSEFMIDILKVEKIESVFNARVGLHESCHGLRGLRLGRGSERQGVDFSKLAMLLDMVDGVERVPVSRGDECCGFGGTFAVNEEAVSVRMGLDRIADHVEHGAEYITSGDMSCLMHLEGIISRNNIDIKVIHLAEILNSQNPS